MTAAALPAEAVVDLAAVQANVQALRAAAPSSQLMAVVKADGYGHGMLPCARAAVAAGADWLGVAFLAEAMELRRAGVTAPVLAWLVGVDEPLAAVVGASVDLGVNACWLLERAAAAARQTGTTARLHLKIDTGLHRAGATAADWPELVEAAAKLVAEGSVAVVGIWSHFAYADAPGHPTVAGQVAAFREALEVADRAGVRPELRHLANSAATLTSPSAHFDLVRPGLAVYGLSPVPEVGGPAAYGLRPAMTLLSQVALTKSVPAGVGVSYGHRYTTPRPTRLALVPLGYADGVPRNATNVGELLIGGRRRRISGTVCMDQLVVDIEDDEVATGDEVILFGPGDAGEPTAQDWAEATGTISYEIVTRVGARVPRRYVGSPE